MKTADGVQAELNQLQTQRDNLQREFAAAESAHEEARASLVRAGGKREIDAATVAHSRLGALTEALTLVDGRIADKQAELKAAQEQAKRASNVQRVREIEEEKAAVMQNFNAAREAAAVALGENVRVMSEAMARWNALVREAEALGHRTLSRFAACDLPVYGHAVGSAFAAFINEQERVAAKARSRVASAREREREKRLPATT